MNGRWRAPDWAVWLAALTGPALVTAVLVRYSSQTQRDYVFIYLGLVAVVGVLRGLWPALACAAVSFLLVDYFFVPPVGTLTIADEQDIVNLIAFLVTAGVVGVLASRRRTALLAAEALTRQLRESNTELIRLNKEQAEALGRAAAGPQRAADTGASRDRSAASRAAGKRVRFKNHVATLESPSSADIP